MQTTYFMIHVHVVYFILLVIDPLCKLEHAATAQKVARPPIYYGLITVSPPFIIGIDYDLLPFLSPAISKEVYIIIVISCATYHGKLYLLILHAT